MTYTMEIVLLCVQCFLFGIGATVIFMGIIKDFKKEREENEEIWGRK